MRVGFEEFEEIPDNIKEGLKLMQAVDFPAWKQSLSKTDMKYLPDNDKINLVYIFFEEFEKEYSFILTSNKIKINIVYVNKDRISYKDKLNDIYVQIPECIKNFDEYFFVMKDIDALKNDSSINEVEHYKKAQSINLKRSNSAYKCKKSVYSFLQQTEEVLKVLIDDYNSEKKLLEEVEEQIFFNKEIEGEKKSQGMKIIDSIIRAYLYISAFLYRLEDGGDLGGLSPEFSENEIKIQENIKQQLSETEKIEGSNLPSQEKIEAKSFLEELAEYVTKENR